VVVVEVVEDWLRLDWYLGCPPVEKDLVTITTKIPTMLSTTTDTLPGLSTARNGSVLDDGEMGAVAANREACA